MPKKTPTDQLTPLESALLAQLTDFDVRLRTIEQNSQSLMRDFQSALDKLNNRLPELPTAAQMSRLEGEVKSLRSQLESLDA